MTDQSVDPCSGKVCSKYPELDEAQREQAIATAESTDSDWKLSSYTERAVIVARAAKILNDRADEFTQRETTEMGKRRARARRHGQPAVRQREAGADRRQPGVGMTAQRTTRPGRAR